MCRRWERFAPNRIHSSPVSGCTKEKETGLSQGRLPLAILFALFDEGTGFLDVERTVLSFTWKADRLSASFPTIFLCPSQDIMVCMGG